jgi:hypothetical protein
MTGIDLCATSSHRRGQPILTRATPWPQVEYALSRSETDGECYVSQGLDPQVVIAGRIGARLSNTAERDDPVEAWLSLPRRIYLDTSTLQKLYDFSGEIFEGDPFQPVGRAARVQSLADEIDALRMIFMVNERAMFEFVVTAASLREVINRTRPGYTQWSYDVLDTWLIQSEGEKPPTPGTTLEHDQRERPSAAPGGARLAL